MLTETLQLLRAPSPLSGMVLPVCIQALQQLVPNGAHSHGGIILGWPGSFGLPEPSGCQDDQAALKM